MDLMDRLFEFVVSHYILASLFVAFLLAILVLESRRGGSKISAQGAVSLLNRNEAVVVDIRDRKEFAEGRITGSINIPLNSLKSRAGELSKHKDKQIIVADKMGQHSAMAVKQLNAEGYANVVRLNGGVGDWKASNLPLVKK
nr:rhodanese-like domain-containing protein [Marinobacter sp.]